MTDAAAIEGPAFELPTELAIDADTAQRIIGEFIRAQLQQAGFEKALLGLSGGIDSALVAYLVADAIGPERLLAVLMPYRTSSPQSRQDAEAVVQHLGCASELVEISAIVDGYFEHSAGDADSASPLRRGNFMARARMMVLYDHSVTWGGLVVGTGNKTETLIGYTTLWGDSASAFNPIGDLYKSQIRQLAQAVGVPDVIVRKAPSADLWPGQTDEAEVGFSYAEVDRILFRLVDRRLSIAEIVADGFERATVERVDRMVAGAEFKRQVPPIARSGRAQPASTISTRVGGHVRRVVDRAAAAEAAGSTDQGPGTLYVVATPIGNLGDITLRALEVLRSVAVVAAEDTRLTRRIWERHGLSTPLVSYHAHSDSARTRELLARLAGGDDVALVTDAGTPLVSDPGEDLVGRWIAADGVVVPIPGPSAVLAALVAAGIPAPRWTFEGFLPRRGRERTARLARVATDERATVIFEAPARTAATLRDLAAACGADRRAALCRELTKRYEEIRRGTLEELAADAHARPPKGEVTLVVAGAVAGSARRDADVDLAEGRRQVQSLVDAGMPRSAAARDVAAMTGLARRELFDRPEGAS